MLTMLRLMVGRADLAKTVVERNATIQRLNQSIARLKEIVGQRDRRIQLLVDSQARAVHSFSGELVPGTSISAKYLNYLRFLGFTVPVRELTKNPGEPNLVALRHDIDYDIDVALEMARLEHEMGCSATYYLLHTTPYWNHPSLLEKALRIQEYGHEIGLHINVLSEWMSARIADPAARLAELLAPLREAGVRVTGTAAHGDPLCYERGFINYWCFSELRPRDISDENGRTAEGIKAPMDERSIPYPPDDSIRRSDGSSFRLWSVSMKELGLEYHAWHTEFDGYFTDSGGSWSRSPDPVEADLSKGRHQVLIHPIHWSTYTK